MVQLDFNPSEYEPTTFGDPLKPDWYATKIAAIELKATKDGKGAYLEITYAVDENRHPESAGRNVWDRLTVHHHNETAKKIARGKLNKVQQCVGRPACQNTDELIGLPLMLKLKVRPATEQYEASNEVADYRPMGGVVPTSVPSQQPVGAAGVPAQPHAFQPQMPVGAPMPVNPVAPAATPAWMRK
jgi:hypothetical protein